MNNDIYLIIFSGVITLIAYLLLMKISFFKESNMHTLVFSLFLAALTIGLAISLYFIRDQPESQTSLNIVGILVGIIIGFIIPILPFFKKNIRYQYISIGVVSIITTTLLCIQYFVF